MPELGLSSCERDVFQRHNALKMSFFGVTLLLVCI